MNFTQLRHRVDRAERLVQGRADDTQSHWQRLQRVWREGWTPLRIVVAGLATGFVAGKLEPAQGKAVATQATRWLQMLTTVSGMFTAAQAQKASDHAERAADNAQAVAEDEPVPRPIPVADPRLSAAQPPPAHALDDGLPYAPRPAEAATEISER